MLLAFRHTRHCGRKREVYTVHLMKIIWKHILRGACIAFAVYAAVVAGLIAFGGAWIITNMSPAWIPIALR